MATLKVLIGFSSIRDDDMDTKTANIIKSMTGNANHVTHSGASVTLVPFALCFYNITQLDKPLSIIKISCADNMPNAVRTDKEFFFYRLSGYFA